MYLPSRTGGALTKSPIFPDGTPPLGEWNGCGWLFAPIVKNFSNILITKLDGTRFNLLLCFQQAIGECNSFIQ